MPEIETDGAGEELNFQGPHWVPHNCQTAALRNSDSLFWPSAVLQSCAQTYSQINTYLKRKKKKKKKYR